MTIKEKSTRKPAVLLVDDEPSIQFGFQKYLSKVGYGLMNVSSLKEATESVSTTRFDAILLDMKLPDGNGLDWMEQIRPSHPDVAIVLITGHGDIPLAVEAMRRGVDHFLTKPVNMAELDVFLKKSLELGALRRKDTASQRLRKSFDPFFGESAPMKTVVEMAQVATESDSTVLLQGETGTGKGVLAKWIHENSQLRSAPYVEINCSSLKGDLLASELFGHVKGAFTSAVKDKQGLIEVADGGTLFLDEIGDMDFAVQAQFLKVIEEKQFRRVGEVKMRKSEFRLLCASNKDLIKEVNAGRFREDLFYRINVFPIRIPAIRERMDDFHALMDYLLKELGKEAELDKRTNALLTSYHWPGNIREMKNVLERAMLLARGGPLLPEHFPGLESADVQPISADSVVSLDEIEEKHIKAVLQHFKGETTKAAHALGISRTTLYRRLKEIREKK